MKTKRGLLSHLEKTKQNTIKRNYFDLRQEHPVVYQSDQMTQPTCAGINLKLSVLWLLLISCDFCGSGSAKSIRPGCIGIFRN